jgi:hypothetical protein
MKLYSSPLYKGEIFDSSSIFAHYLSLSQLLEGFGKTDVIAVPPTIKKRTS